MPEKKNTRAILEKKKSRVSNGGSNCGEKS